MKRTLTFCLAVLLLGSLASALWAAKKAALTYRTRLTEHGSGIAGTLPPADYGRGMLEELPALASDPSQLWQMDLRGYDLSRLDLTAKLAELQRADFDSKTVWPSALPAGFNPAAIMDTGKNPGLGVRALHAEGITGKGVGLAILDQGLLVDHVEYTDRLRLYEEIHCVDWCAQMHGPAVASLAVGKTVGVAPDADLYYIAETHRKDNLSSWEGKNFDEIVDFTATATAIDRILEINRSLPKGKKIRVISLSVGWMPSMCGYKEVMEAVERAKRAGVLVLSVALKQTHGLEFVGLDRDPVGDPDAVASYALSSAIRQHLAMRQGSPLLVPMDARATASPTGADDYVFYRQGGISWAVPYLAGLYALACQVKPDVTPEEFWAAALATGDALESTPAAPASREEIEARVTETTDERLAELKEQYKDREDELERLLAQSYTARTGAKKERMTLEEFRVWIIPEQVKAEMGANALQECRIVNPPRLIDSLRSGK